MLENYENAHNGQNNQDTPEIENLKISSMLDLKASLLSLDYNFLIFINSNILLFQYFLAVFWFTIEYKNVNVELKKVGWGATHASRISYVFFAILSAMYVFLT